MCCAHWIAPTGDGGSCAGSVAWNVVVGAVVLMPPPKDWSGAGAGASPIGRNDDVNAAFAAYCLRWCVGTS